MWMLMKKDAPYFIGGLALLILTMVCWLISAKALKTDMLVVAGGLTVLLVYLAMLLTEYQEVLHDAWLNADKSGPLEVAEYSVFLMFTTVGRCYAVSELSGWLEALGFGPVTHVPTAAYRSALVATKLRG